jgi:hypothetical protein
MIEFAATDNRERSLGVGMTLNRVSVGNRTEKGNAQLNRTITESDEARWLALSHVRWPAVSSDLHPGLARRQDHPPA